MRKVGLVLILSILLVTAAAFAEKGVEITPIFGYTYTSKVSAYKGDFDITNSSDWGVMVNVDIESYTYKGTMLESLYNRQDSEAEFYECGSRLRKDLFHMSVDYYQIGVLNKLHYDNVEPFGEVLIGATRLSAKSDVTIDGDTFRPSDEWMFSATLGIGARLMVSQRIGFRVHGRLLLPMSFSGGGLWCAGGCTIGVSGSSCFVQGNLGAGIIIRF